MLTSAHESLVRMLKNPQSISPEVNADAIINELIDCYYPQPDAERMASLIGAMESHFVALYVKDAQNLSWIERGIIGYNANFRQGDDAAFRACIDQWVRFVRDEPKKEAALSHLAQDTLDSLCIIADSRCAENLERFGPIRQWHRQLTRYEFSYLN